MLKRFFSLKKEMRETYYFKISIAGPNMQPLFMNKYTNSKFNPLYELIAQEDTFGLST